MPVWAIDIDGLEPKSSNGASLDEDQARMNANDRVPLGGDRIVVSRWNIDWSNEDERLQFEADNYNAHVNRYIKALEDLAGALGSINFSAVVGGGVTYIGYADEVVVTASKVSKGFLSKTKQKFKDAGSWFKGLFKKKKKKPELHKNIEEIK